MRKYTRKLMAAAMCAAMTASMIPASTWAGENTDEMSVIRIMGINNTVTTVNGGTVSLKDWIESGNSRLYNTFTEELAKRNIKLEFNLVEEDQYTTVCQTTVASGNLGCDIMYIEPLDDKTKQRLIDRGIFAPINEIWDQSEEGTAKEFFTEGDGKFVSERLSMEDGNVYWLADIQTSNYKGEVTTGAALAFNIRKDWLDACDLETPTTLDEFTSALKTFQDKDCNGNGVADEVITMNIAGFGTDIAQWFGLGPGMVFIDPKTDTLTSPWYQDHIKDYISYMNSLYEAGLLVDITNQTNTRLAANQMSGEANWAAQTWEEPSIQVQEGAQPPYLEPIVIKATDDTEPFVRLQSGENLMSRIYAVTNECEDTAAVARLLDYMCSPEYVELTEHGVEGVNFTRTEDGDYQQLSGDDIDNSIMSLMYGALWSSNVLPRMDLNKDMSTELVAGIQLGKDAGIPEGYQAKADFADWVFTQNMENTVNYSPLTMLAVATQEETKRTSEILTDLDTYSQELLTKLILGQKSLDDWDSYMDDLKRLGLDELTEIYQGRYDRTKR